MYVERMIAEVPHTTAYQKRHGAIDPGAGTGQVAVPLATRLAGVLALGPEPDMLAQRRRHAQEERGPT